MIYTTLPVAQLCKNQVIALGRQMENNYRQIIFDVSDFDEPITSLMLVHQRKGDAAPYIVDNVTGTQFAWTITDTDTAYAGYGKGELRINFANGLAKSIVFTTMVVKSITGDTVIPEPLQSWYDALIEYIDEHSVSPEELDQAIADYIEQHPIEAPVTSVNTKTGAVVLTASDVGALSTSTTAADLGAYVKPTGGIPVSDLNTTAKSRLMPTGGTTGQVLAKASGTNYDVEWVNQSGGGGAVDSVNGQTGTVVLDADDVGALPDTTTAADLGAYVKPSGGIPKTDLASAVQTSLGKADTALQTAPVQSVDGKTGAVTVLPTGGASGQVLAKSSASDYAVEWVNQSGGGGGDFTQVIQMQTTEDAQYIILTEDANGNPLSFEEAYVVIVTARATSASSNGNFGISLEDEWHTSFNAYCLYNFPLNADAYRYWFNLKKAGPLATVTVMEKTRVANNMEGVTYWPSEEKWSGDYKLGVNGNSATMGASVRSISDMLDNAGKIKAITIGVDTASAVKIAAGTRIEVWVK